jgi:hypothetical protein
MPINQDINEIVFEISTMLKIEGKNIKKLEDLEVEIITYLEKRMKVTCIKMIINMYSDPSLTPNTPK